MGVYLEDRVIVNAVRAVPNTKGFVESLSYFSIENILVDVFLRSYPLDTDVPKGLLDKIRCIRIIQISEDTLTVGPKKPFVTAIIPFDEIAAITVSSETTRPDEDEIDERIEAECPAWEREFAAEIGSKRRKMMKRNKSDAIQSLHPAEFWDCVKSEEYAVVDVYAPWCQPCKEVEVVLQELAENHGNRAIFARLDGDEDDKLTEELNISAYPTVLLFQNGQIERTIEGARSFERYEREIEILLGLRKREELRNERADGSVSILSSETLMDYVDDSMASVIMFFERGDYECQLQSRVMRELAQEYRGRVLFAKADVDAEKELAELFEVEGTPELYFVLDGEVVAYVDGRMTRGDLRQELNELLKEAGLS